MNPVRITPLYKASPDKLFAAWTEPDIMKKWLFRSDTSVIERIETDLRPQGRFSIVERSGDKAIDHFGQYIAIEAPRALSFTLEVPEHFQGSSYVGISFKPSDEGCEMDFLQEGVDPKWVEADWRRMFSALALVFLRG